MPKYAFKIKYTKTCPNEEKTHFTQNFKNSKDKFKNIR